jgi:hypothetical protein
MFGDVHEKAATRGLAVSVDAGGPCMSFEQLSINTAPVPKPAPIPVARPARPKSRLQISSQPETSSVAETINWLDRETYRGLPTSLAVHGLLLLGLTFWVFSAKPKPRVIDGRLMGSEMGVEDGLFATGGLNTELDIAASAEVLPEPVVTTLAPVDLAALEASLPKPAAATKASAAGGMNNPNPGAGMGDGFGLARFGDGGENIQGVMVRVGDPQFTLLWDSNVDLDLHVIEPGGKEIHTFERKSNKGGELDVDNMKGFGPENIYWMHEDEETGERTKGQGPPGEYKWFVVYWGGFDNVPKVTHWKVRVKANGKVNVYTGRLRNLNEKSKMYTLTLEPKAAK